MKRILYVSSECVPFIKTGGLADVVGSLPKYINKEEIDVRVVLPKYMCMSDEYKNKLVYVDHFYMQLAWRDKYVGILEYIYDGIHFYFIDNEYYFTGIVPYGNIYEDVEKFAFFCKATLSILPTINFQPDVIHCHDWQTGLIPVYLKDIFVQNPFYSKIKTIMTIHNLKFQGIWDVKTVMDLAGLDKKYFVPDKLEAYGDANLLKGGLVYADFITTVSETYAKEITMPFFGEGLDGLLRARSNELCGIVNGIDYNEYDPEKDPIINFRYNVDTVEEGKKQNKLALQRKLGLKEDESKFMIGIVSRLTDQKGLDLIDCVMEQLCLEDTQFVILGTGQYKYENMFRYFAAKYPDRVSANIYYNEILAHEIYSACDTYLMPSLYEPCGLSQIISMRYGIVPIVRETGGLKDTVEAFDEYEHTGTGFSFANYNAHEMLRIVQYAKSIYYDRKEEWKKIVSAGMLKNFSWVASAKKYEELYYRLCQ